MRRIFTLILILFNLTLWSQIDTIIITQELEAVEIQGIRSNDKSPISQKTLKQKSIEVNYHSQELPLYLNSTPSITSSSDGGHNHGYVYFRLRGIDQTRINMTLEGVPLNEPEDQGVYFSNYPDFLNSVKSVQIQRGVGTSSNGVSSYAGSINFEAQNGLQKEGTQIEIMNGSWLTTKLALENYSGLNKNKTAIYTRFSGFGTQGYKYHSGNTGYSIFINAGYYGNKDVLEMIAFSGRIHNQLAWFAVDKYTIEEVDLKINYNTKREDDDFNQTMLILKYKKKLTKNTNFTTAAFFNHLDGAWRLDMLPLGGGDTIHNYQLSSNFYGLITNFNITRQKFRLNVGLNGNVYERNHWMAYLPQIEKQYLNTGHKNELAGYVKTGFDLGKLTFFGDIQLRNTFFEYEGDYNLPKQNWFFINPKGGLLYNFNQQINTYFYIGQSHREPTRTDIFMGEDNPTTHKEIKPEEVIDFELGTNLKMEKLAGQVNLYYMNFKNEITLLGALGSNGLPLMTNVQNSYRSGLEIDLTYQPWTFFQADGNASFSYNRIKDVGRQFEPLYTPSTVINLGTQLHNNKRQVFVRFESKIHSKSYIDWENTMITPAFAIFNTQIGVKIKNIKISTRLNNLFDKLYYTNGYADLLDYNDPSLGLTEYYYVNPPRHVMVTLKVFFNND